MVQGSNNYSDEKETEISLTAVTVGICLGDIKLKFASNEVA